MSVAAEAHGKLDINRVQHHVLATLRRNWRALLRPALLYLYLPGVVVGLLEPHGGPFGMGRAPWSAAPLASLAALVPYAIFQGGLIRLIVADLRAEAVSTDEALRAGRERLWALYGLSLLAGLAIAAGLCLFVVPGVIAALAWCVAGPVLIEEQRPVLQTFGRSAELTRGSRVNILGVGLMIILAELVASTVLGLLSTPLPGLVAYAAVWPLLSAATSVVGGVTLTVIYEELRALHGDPA